jgi:formylglycine-generating enzyme required for sulfatase activity
MGADFSALVRRLEEEPDVTIRRALLLSLGEFDEKAFAPDARQAMLPKVQNLYRTEADPGLHAAAEWLLRTWLQEAWLKQVKDEWAKDEEQRGKRLQAIKQSVRKDKDQTPQWYVTGQGQMMVVIPGPVVFQMGSPPTEAGRFPWEHPLHHQRIGHTFAIAAKPVTVEQFLKFRNSLPYVPEQAPTPDCPVQWTKWYDAVAYCNWLSNQEGLPEKEWCYEPNKNGRYEEGMKLATNYLKRTGYRLPTEAEWEYACRARAVTSRYYGESEELLRNYAWYNRASNFNWPVARLKPNDWGLFDMHGNVWVWCQDSWKERVADQGERILEDTEDAPNVFDKDDRALRGGSSDSFSRGIRCAVRNKLAPTYDHYDVGFRPARTIAP